MTPEQFISAIRARLDIGDRQCFFKVGSTGTVYVQFYNVPQGVENGAERENNRLMLVVSGVPKRTVELAVRGPAFGTDFKLRSKTAEPESIVKYVTDFLNRAAKKEPRRL